MNKRTSLYQRHVNLDAKMVDFAGYDMPLQYSSVTEEHLAVRKNVGIFDVSHMGEFIVRGRQAMDLVQAISSNDASALIAGQAQYSCIPNDDGGIVDDMLVYRLFDDQCSEGEQAFMLVVNASNIEKDWTWILSKNTFECKIIDISEKTGLIALQGPMAVNILRQITDVDLEEIAYYHFVKDKVAGCDNILISATGYTGSGGFEIYGANDEIVKIWDALVSIDDETKVVPCGLAARDTLRLEMGFCLYGNDIDDHTSPLEAGLGWITKLKKTPDFPSKSKFIEERKIGSTKKLVGFKMDDRRVPRKDYEIYDMDENLIGRVTSGTFSPSLEQPIGLGYVETQFAKIGIPIQIKVGSKYLSGYIVKLPFVQT